MMKTNILLVDDTPENLIALEAVLEPLNLNIIKATSGREALRCVLEYELAMILLDIHMPGMDGLEAAKLIRMRENSKNIPIIFLTAYQTGDIDVLRAYSVGGIDFLLKPIIPEILLYKVEILINLFNHNKILAAHSQALEQVNLELEQQLETIQQLNRQLEDANEQLEAFVYSTTHDLRAPLRIVQSFGKTLMDKYLGDVAPEGRDYLKRIVDKAQSMTHLIDDLLNLAYASQSEVSRQEVNISQIVHGIMEELVSLAPNRQIEIQIQPNLIVLADKDLLKIALDNLLRNAWKFTSKCDMPVIEFGMIHHQNQRVYIVRDNGAGFDMEKGEKLFKPFQRLHNKNDFDGTGIGLTIVRRIIERHGGHIWFEAAVNYGVTFYFTLSSPQL
ncbi:MAG: response regulator [Chitinophagaceae bacterium]|nr:response regulator [Anaerolineae bacterium]